MALIATDLTARHHGRFAQAMAAGYERSHVPDAEALADEKLTGDETDAGYRWAESNALDNTAACPDYTPRFREGCAAYVTDQRR